MATEQFLSGLDALDSLIFVQNAAESLDQAEKSTELTNPRASRADRQRRVPEQRRCDMCHCRVHAIVCGAPRAVNQPPMGWCKLGIVDERVIGGHPQHRRMRSPKDLEDMRKGQTRH
jgi:hypothetical protein